MQRRKFIQAGIVAAWPSMQIWAGHTQVHTGNSEVINAGKGGNNTVDLLERIDKDCLIHRPQLTVLMVGTNDMNSRKFVPLNQYQINLQRIIDKIRTVKSKIVLMNILPVYEPYLFTRHDPSFYKPEGHSERLAQMNACIKFIADRNQLVFLDLHHIFKNIGNIGLDKDSLIKNQVNSNVADGVHPTAQGYRIIALAVYDVISANHLPRKYCLLWRQHYLR